MRKYTQTEVGLPKIEDTPFLAVPMQWRVWRTREFGVSPMFWTSCRVLWVQATDHFALQFFEGAAGSVNHLHQETATVLKVFQKHHAHSMHHNYGPKYDHGQPMVYGHPVHHLIRNMMSLWSSESMDHPRILDKHILSGEITGPVFGDRFLRTNFTHELGRKCQINRQISIDFDTNPDQVDPLKVSISDKCSVSPLDFIPLLKKWLVTNHLRSMGWSSSYH